MVTSAKMEKTIVVKVTRLVKHKLYTRVMKVTKKFYAHDEKREARLGDTREDRGNPADVEAEALAAGRGAYRSTRVN